MYAPFFWRAPTHRTPPPRPPTHDPVCALSVWGEDLETQPYGTLAFSLLAFPENTGFDTGQNS